ncbi:UNVERIFIED_CONTAM: hypothetical protein Slati_2261900 [Sesamum latifolium]|uniref:Reverse transcriptase domain-containing protein n=1 Tax=Sesamum latifolium TaxID=2727402 RepID=A0AAW2WU42_9LAMI
MGDLGTSINVMPLAIYESLNVDPLKEKRVVLQLADCSIVYPEGVLEDVLVKANELVFPADFYVLDMMGDNSPSSTSILLGRPFLKTSKTKIDVDDGILSMEFDNEVYFYEGLTKENRSLVDAASGGALYEKTPTEARKLITTMADNNKKFSNRNDNSPRKVNEVSVSINERLDQLTSLVKKYVVGGSQEVKACGICTSPGHFTDACPTLHEEPTEHANVVGGFSEPSQRGYNPFPNTYNPGWKDHPNLRYGN